MTQKNDTTATTTKKYFDYNNECPTREIRAVARKNAQLGHAILKRTITGVWEMGKLLTETKELLGHGSFGRWIEAEFEMSHSTALNFMRVYDSFKFATVANLNIPLKALYALSAPSISDDDREAAVELIQSGDIKTVADVKTAISPPKSPETDTESNSPTARVAQDSPHSSTGFDSPKTDAEEGPQEDAENETTAESDSAPTSDEPNAEASPSSESSNDSTATSQQAQQPSQPNKTVIYDTLTDAKKEDDLTLEEWLNSLPIYRVLAKLPGKGIIAQRSLLDYHSIRKALSTFQHHAARCETVKHPDSTMLSTALNQIHSLKHPREWQICAPCKGRGCDRCGFAGYDTSGAGISPTRVENGEVEL